MILNEEFRLCDQELTNTWRKLALDGERCHVANILSECHSLKPYNRIQSWENENIFEKSEQLISLKQITSNS